MTLGACIVIEPPDGNLNDNGAANDNGATNANANDNGSANDNGTANDNANDNGTGNDNANDNAANGNDNAPSGNGNDNDVDLIQFAPITFDSGPVSVDPFSVPLGQGNVDFENGMIGTLGQPPLYFDGAFAWIPNQGQVATISFVQLDVRRVQLYFAHDLPLAGLLQAVNADGEVLESLSSVFAIVPADPNAVMVIESDEPIDRLVVEVPAGATVVVDHLIVTAAQ